MTVERGTRVIARWFRSMPTSTPHPSRWCSAGCRSRRVRWSPCATPRGPVRGGPLGVVIDVVDDVDGSYAALGSEPAVGGIEVVALRGRDPLE